ncbi:MAG: hypothetical protein M0006_03390 [Magnetospirillum sp.]|nr:hypothetical protein [Magnetospirillum sp.]
MKGYRTLIFNLAMALSGMLGYHLAPDVAAHYADLFLFAITAGNAALRFVTDTPVGHALLPSSAAVSLERLADAVAERMPRFDPAAIAALIPAAAAPPPASDFDFAGLADSLGKAIDGLRAAHIAVTAALPPAGECPAPQAAASGSQPATGAATQAAGGANA